ncbi:MAG: hypothetical protein JNM18_21215 [Planctomycetaceae bacterium]|nr:hypothetical protein [Planctomycetaceae bacterium]
MGRWMSAGVFGIVLGLAISTATAQTGAIDDAVGRGIRAYFQGQPAAVEQYMTLAINAGSRDPQSLYFRGLALWQMGRQDEARADFAQGARLEAVSPGMYRTSARSLERVQGTVRLELQRARQTARVMTTAQREKDRLARFDLQTGKSLAPESVPAPTATAATPMPMTSATDPTAPKPAGMLPSADPFATPKPAMPPMPAPTPAPAASPAPAVTTPVAVTMPLALPAEPELLYAEIVKQTANGRADIFWEMLPAKHQNDVKGLVQALGAKMDKELWEKSFTVLGKVANVLKTKREFITGHPAVAGALMNLKVNDQPATPEQIQQGLDVTATFLQTIFTSEISTVDGLAKLDPQAFLAGTVSKSMKLANDAMVQLSGKTKEQLIDETLAKSKITANKMGDDAVELTFETQGVEPTATISKTMLWKRVDGKWLPAEMVDGWDEKVAQAKTAIETTDFAGPPKAAVATVTTLVEPILDQLLAAQDQDAFNGVIAGVLPLVQGMLGGLMPMPTN